MDECQHCGRPMGPSKGSRRKLYCDARCKQAAYRAKAGGPRERLTLRLPPAELEAFRHYCEREAKGFPDHCDMADVARHELRLEVVWDRPDEGAEPCPEWTALLGACPASRCECQRAGRAADGTQLRACAAADGEALWCSGRDEWGGKRPGPGGDPPDEAALPPAQQ